MKKYNELKIIKRDLWIRSQNNKNNWIGSKLSSKNFLRRNYDFYIKIYSRVEILLIRVKNVFLARKFVMTQNL